ncbi:MAG TPA: glutathione S-transferase family protein [Verrucomicrobiae bacterium]|nr:glutathione S-transferase family protein [Verrucomicrobiae bacterium]
MSMKLFSSKTSPFARKVRVAIEELGLADQVEEIVADPFNPPAELLAANPLSKIPTLVTDRGEAIPDSSLILDYLSTKKSGLATLVRGAKRWEVLRRTQIADGIIECSVASVLEKRRPESIHYIPFLDRQVQNMNRALDVLNADAGLLQLQTPGTCEITVGVALGYLDFRLPYVEWRRGRDALATWYTVFAQRPSMVKTQPPVQ